MSDLPTLKTPPARISSRVSADGRKPCALSDSPTKQGSGQVRRPASRSASPVKNSDSTIPATLPPNSLILSASAALAGSLANRLAARFASDGRGLYKTSYKNMDISPHSQCFRLVASARPIDVSAFTSALTTWLTPTVTMIGGRSAEAAERRRQHDGRAKLWHPGSLWEQATLTIWATPAARDGKGGYKGGRIRNGKLSLDTLDVSAQLSTPIRFVPSGGVLIGFYVATAASGQLNPALSRWLMGFPQIWDLAAIRAHRRKVLTS